MLRPPLLEKLIFHHNYKRRLYFHHYNILPPAVAGFGMTNLLNERGVPLRGFLASLRNDIFLIVEEEEEEAIQY